MRFSVATDAYAVPLDTANRAVAARRLAPLLADESASLAESQRGETFREATERVNVQRVADGVTTAKDELARLRTYAFPLFENVPAWLRGGLELFVLWILRCLIEALPCSDRFEIPVCTI